MCKIRVKGTFDNYSIINCHAPTDAADEEEKDAYYEQFHKELPKA